MSTATQSPGRTAGPGRRTAPASRTRTTPRREGVFILVPAYNEGPSLGAVLRELARTYPNVVVVDDGSRDDTYDVARSAAKYVLRHVVNRGQGAALQTALEFALRHDAEIVVTFDADGQHDVADIEKLIDPIRRGECDITLGSRFLGRAVDLPPTRRYLLRLAVLFTRLVSRVHLTDAHNGLRAFSGRAARRIRLTLDRMAHASEIIDQIAASGLPWREVPVTVRYTPYSLTKGQSSSGALRVACQYLFGRMMK